MHTERCCTALFLVSVRQIYSLQITAGDTGAVYDHKHAAPHPIAREKASTMSASQ